MMEGGNCTGRAGTTPDTSGSETVELQKGSGDPMEMLQFPFAPLEMLPMGTRNTVSDTAGVQRGT